jgi:uncharacterized protein (TIGR03437 family)
MSIHRTIFLTALCAVILVSQAAASNVVLLPGQNGSNATVNVYSADPLSSVGSFAASAQSFQIAAEADGSRYYVLAKSSTNTLVVTDGNLSVLQTLDLDPGASMALSPDGKRLFVLTSRPEGSQAPELRVFDISGTSVTEVTPASGPDVGLKPIDVTFSHDSSRAFILSSDSHKLTVVNVNTLAVLGSISIPGLSTGVAVAPSGRVYVSAENRIYEIDGGSVALTGQILLNGRPGRLVFTPDGKHALALNQTPVTGKMIWYFNLDTVTEEAYWSNINETVDKIVVVGNNRAFASSISGRLFDIALNPFLLDEATFSNLPGNQKFSGVRSITASDELPSAKYLFVAASDGSLTRVNLATDLTAGQVSPGSVAGVAAFAGPAAAGTPASVLKFNDNQQVDPGATTRPLVVRALSNTGRPMAGVPVTFSTVTPGAVIQNALTVTNASGFAQATVQTPSTTGNVIVTVDLGGAAVTTTFTVIVGEGGTGGGGGLSIYSGDGQVVRLGFRTSEPLLVKLVNDNGEPRPNAVVTFAIETGTGTLNIPSGYQSGGGATSGTQIKVKTKSDGIAGVHFLATGIVSGTSSYEQSTISAMVDSGKVNFTTTTAYITDPTVLLLAPTGNRRINGKVGQIIPGAIKVRVVVTAGLQAGQGIPGVGVRTSTGVWNPDTHQFDPVPGPTADCAGGYTLTDAAGLATCDLVIGPEIGSASLTVWVGGFNLQTGLTLNVAPGDAALIEKLSGDDQVGNPGQQLPVPLTARITDAGGNPLPGAPAQWEVVTPGTATLSNTTSVADSSAVVSTTVTLGNIAGPLLIRVRSGAASATFNLSVSVPIAGVQVVSGDGQTTHVNTAFAQPLVAKVVDAQGNPVSGIWVGFVVLSGSASLSATSAISDAVGLVSVDVTAGATPGQIRVQAGSGDYATVFTLNAVPPGPIVTQTGIVNSISGDMGVTPGGIIAIYGAGLAPGINGSVIGWNVVGPLPLTLAGVEVMFGSIPAPIYSVNNINGQEWVVVQAPYELTAPGTVAVTIKVGGGSTVVNNVGVKQYQPGIFEAVGTGGQLYGVVLKEDGSYVSPTSPATLGSRLRMFIAGVGQTDPPAGTNQAGVPGQKITAKVIVGVNDAGVPVVTTEALVGAVGVSVVTFDLSLPADTPRGSSRPLAVAVLPEGGTSLIFGNPSTIAIQ